MELLKRLGRALFGASDSPPGAVGPADLAAVLRGALVAGAGAALTYLLANLGAIDFGVWTPLVTALAAVLVNLLRKLGTGPEPPPARTNLRVRP